MHQNEISDFIFLENNKILTAGYDGCLNEINYKTGESKQIFKHKNWIYEIRISPSKKYLVFSGSKTMDLYIINLETEKLIKVLNGNFNRFKFQFHPIEDVLFYSTDRGSETAWYNIETGEHNRLNIEYSDRKIIGGLFVESFTNSGDLLILTAFSKYYVGNTRYQKVYIGKYLPNESEVTIIASYGFKNDITISKKNNENLFLVVNWQNSALNLNILQLNPHPFLEIQSIRLDPIVSSLYSIDISKDNTLIAATDWDILYFIDSAGNILRKEKGVITKGMKAHFSPSENILVVISHNSSITVWKYEMNSID